MRPSLRWLAPAAALLLAACATPPAPPAPPPPPTAGMTPPLAVNYKCRFVYAYVFRNILNNPVGNKNVACHFGIFRYYFNVL